jgi:hypothetical protein
MQTSSSPPLGFHPLRLLPQDNNSKSTQNDPGLKDEDPWHKWRVDAGTPGAGKAKLRLG